MGSTGSGYTKFESEPDRWDSRAFAGSGEDVINFFEEYTNNYEILSKIDFDDPEAASAFKRWGQGDFMFGQQYYGFSSMDKREQDMTRIFDKYIDQSVINKGFITRRLASPSLLFGKGSSNNVTEEQLKSVVGKEVIAKGNMSTSAASTGLNIGENHPIEYVISFPKGSKGAGLWIGDRAVNYWDVRQREFMTNRDTAYKVTGYKYNKQRNIWEVSLKFKGQVEHDYS